MSEESENMDRLTPWEIIGMLLGGLLFAGFMAGILFLAAFF